MFTVKHELFNADDVVTFPRPFIRDPTAGGKYMTMRANEGNLFTLLYYVQKHKPYPKIVFVDAVTDRSGEY